LKCDDELAIYTQVTTVTLFEILACYGNILMTKNDTFLGHKKNTKTEAKTGQ